MALAPLLALLLAVPPGAWVFDAPFGGELATLASVAPGGLRRPRLTVRVRPNDLPRGRLSPDGHLAAWTVVPPGGKGLQDALVQVADLATGQPRTLDDRAELLNTPCWSQDGRRLAYVRIAAIVSPPGSEPLGSAPLGQGKIQRQSTEAVEVWTAAPDGSSPTRAYAATTYGLSLAAFLESGPLLYEDDGQGHYRLLAVTSQGGARTLTTLPGPARAFQLIASGQSLLYTVRTEGTSRWEVLATSLATGKTSTLLTAEGDRLEPFAAGPWLLVSAPGQLLRLSPTGARAAPPLPEAIVEAATADGRFAVERTATGLALLEPATGVAEPLPSQPIAAVLGLAPGL